MHKSDLGGVIVQLKVKSVNNVPLASLIGLREDVFNLRVEDELLFYNS